MSGIATPDTIAALIDAGHTAHIALAAPNRPPLPYSKLREHVQRTVAGLNALGIGRNDRVAIVLDNGPEAASAFLAIAAGATAAPLNPAYRCEDFRFYLADLGAKALIVERNANSPAIAAANALNIPVLRLTSVPADPAGTFSIIGDPIGAAKRCGFAGVDDVALVLHTSGTTARPKRVPLSHGNLAASARHIGKTLQLVPEDRCLNVMPLFHIHGLVAGVLSSVAAGGSVFCAPGLNAQQFFRRAMEGRPTWYTAVPTMHQAVLAQCSEDRTALDQVKLRFIRSSSAALPQAVMRKLERSFDAPVIESYGMTEAAHQMTSNPLPPAVRKPGTVGPAAGPDVAIMGPDQALLPTGTTGEVVIRGPNVTAGYEDNPAANAEAFVNGWFRTGDQGVVDEDGYLSITGRLKEIINRGGEKVSPQEVDDALMQHPDVSAVATFAIPHPTLGEEIGAAVVLSRGARLTERALAQFLFRRLSDSKIPRRFVFVNEIPKAATGKIQRRALAAAFGLSGVVAAMRASKAADKRPATPLENDLKRLWQSTLALDTVGLHDDFFLLGGDSLQAVNLIKSVEEELGYSLPQSVLIQSGTIAELARRIDADAATGCIVPFRVAGQRPAFFCVHDVSGQVLNFRHLARYVGEDQPFYGIQSVGLDGKRPPLLRIEDMAARYISEIRNVQPAGPYYLGGFSMGGWVAYEMTRQLQAQGESVGMLALIDAHFGHERRRATFLEWFKRRWSEFRRLSSGERAAFIAQRIRRAPPMMLVSLRTRWRKRKAERAPVTRDTTRLLAVDAANLLATSRYRLEPLDCDAVLFKTTLAGWDDANVHEGWRSVITGRLEMRTVAGRHAEVVNEPFVQSLAAALQDALAEARDEFTP